MSDQDFFFDEDEQPQKGSAKAAPTSKSAPAAKAAAAAPAAQSPMTVMILVGVVAALLGVIIGIFVGRSMVQPAVVATPTTTAPTGQQAAPQLSPDQLQGGELPEGHPDIGSMGGGATGEAPSEETTGQ